MAGKTIIHYFLDENKPNGVNYTNIKNSKICMWFIPKSDIHILKERKEMQSPAFYILLGDYDNSKKIYLGESENFSKRVIDHDSKKCWWDKVLLFISEDNTKADVQYLEYIAIKTAKENKSDYDISENKQIQICIH